MTELMKPRLGALPWKPRRGLKMVRELSHWDVPTAGILRDWRGRHLLFRRLDGTSGQYSVWAYAYLSRREAREIARLAGEELRSRQFRILHRGAFSCVIAEESAGIIHRFRGSLDRSEAEFGLDPAVTQPRITPPVVAGVEKRGQKMVAQPQRTSVPPPPQAPQTRQGGIGHRCTRDDHAACAGASHP